MRLNQIYNLKQVVKFSSRNKLKERQVDLWQCLFPIPPSNEWQKILIPSSNLHDTTTAVCSIFFFNLTPVCSWRNSEQIHLLLQLVIIVFAPTHKLRSISTHTNSNLFKKKKFWPGRHILQAPNLFQCWWIWPLSVLQAYLLAGNLKCLNVCLHLHKRKKCPNPQLICWAPQDPNCYI